MEAGGWKKWKVEEVSESETLAHRRDWLQYLIYPGFPGLPKGSVSR